MIAPRFTYYYYYCFCLSARLLFTAIISVFFAPSSLEKKVKHFTKNIFIFAQNLKH